MVTGMLLRIFGYKIVEDGGGLALSYFLPRCPPPPLCRCSAVAQASTPRTVTRHQREALRREELNNSDMQFRDVKSTVHDAITELAQSDNFVEQITRSGTKLYSSFKTAIDQDSKTLTNRAKEKAVALVTKCQGDTHTAATKVSRQTCVLYLPGIRIAVWRGVSSPCRLGNFVGRACRQPLAMSCAVFPVPQSFVTKIPGVFYGYTYSVRSGSGGGCRLGLPCNMVERRASRYIQR